MVQGLESTNSKIGSYYRTGTETSHVTQVRCLTHVLKIKRCKANAARDSTSVGSKGRGLNEKLDSQTKNGDLKGDRWTCIKPSERFD